MDSTICWQEVFTKKEDIISREIAGEVILVPIREKLADMQRIFMLNSVAEYIWQRLDGEKSLEEIREGLLADFNVRKEQAEADIQEFVGELLEADVIVRVT